LTRFVLLAAVVAAALLSCSEPDVRRSNPQLLREAERAMLQGNWEGASQKY